MNRGFGKSAASTTSKVTSIDVLTLSSDDINNSAAQFVSMGVTLYFFVLLFNNILDKFKFAKHKLVDKERMNVMVS